MNKDVSTLAYLLWEKAGSPSGRDLEFWLEAEQRMVAARQPVATPSNRPSAIPPGPKTSPFLPKARAKSRRF